YVGARTPKDVPLSPAMKRVILQGAPPDMRMALMTAFATANTVNEAIGFLRQARELQGSKIISFQTSIPSFQITRGQGSRFNGTPTKITFRNRDREQNPTQPHTTSPRATSKPPTLDEQEQQNTRTPERTPETGKLSGPPERPQLEAFPARGWMENRPFIQLSYEIHGKPKTESFLIDTGSQVTIINGVENSGEGTAITIEGVGGKTEGRRTKINFRINEMY
ncbi:hypothetical protein B4U80_12343, partial [Leptotrombidium deliense]